jgi:hypothetical protein
MPHPTPDMIPLADCKPRWLYYIASRNLSMGVYSPDDKGFIGIRTKFGSRFLATEYHWDTGEPYGTAIPYEALEQIPDDIELSLSNDKKLREWMLEAEERYNDTITAKDDARYADLARRHTEKT